MRAEIEVSEPWDFPDTGPLEASVLGFDGAVLLARLDTPVEFDGQWLAFARLTPRHVGGAFHAGGAAIPTNIVLSAGELPPGPPGSDYAAVIGTVRLIDGAF
ncbi:MAG: hypothetical protein ACR2I8_05725 [Steroidobacteraceae bacterium]